MTAATDLDAINYFRSGRLVRNPFPYWDYLRAQSPVLREPHHGVFMVTGYEEAVAVFHDHATFSSCNGVSGPFAEFPVPLEGDDISAIIEEHRDVLPFSDQLPTFDPPKHTGASANHSGIEDVIHVPLSRSYGDPGVHEWRSSAH